MTDESDNDRKTPPPGIPGEPTAAFAMAASDPALRDDLKRYFDELRAYLARQSELLSFQIKEARREDLLRHWSLRVRHVSDVMKLAFELALGFIVVAIALGLGAAIWSASRADGLVIESFNVPAQAAASGLTGEVVASKLLDRLTAMQDATDSSRAASSFAHDWTNDIKVEIPDTGVSLGEVVRFLHDWLGHEMHMSGELVQADGAIALTVRMENEPGQTFESKTGDLNTLIQQAAEAVFARAQPYRFGVYLRQHDRVAEGEALERRTAQTGPPRERAWAYHALATSAWEHGDLAAALELERHAFAGDPNLPNINSLLNAIAYARGHDEEVLKTDRQYIASLRGAGAGEVSAGSIAGAIASASGPIAEDQGDYPAAMAFTLKSADPGFSVNNLRTEMAYDAALMHDIARSRALADAWDPKAPRQFNTAEADFHLARAQQALMLADWRGAIAQLEQVEALTRSPGDGSPGDFTTPYAYHRVLSGPKLAVAHAMLGEFDQADAILKTLPADCDPCARAHGDVEAARKNWDAAARWFALVVARSPSIPFADSDWGRMLLAKGDADGAIAKFESAHTKGPHFADPLELLGEALTAQNRSDRALSKFAEAAKYAPAWGRLHLKWGEALIYAGKADEAHKQFAIASGLDLSAADKTELARMRLWHG